MMFYLRSAILAPLLLVQGRRTRSRVPVLPEAPGAREGTAGAGPALRVLVVGDSAAAGVGAGHQDEALLGRLVADLGADFSVTWALHATSGHTTKNALDRLDQLPQQDFDVAVTSLGVNDTISMVSLRGWRRRQARLRALLRDKFNVSALVISGLPPVHRFPALPQPLRWHVGQRAGQLNRALANDVANQPDCRFIDLRISGDVADMAVDGFHPGPPIYAEWARQVAEAIRDR
ncbi:MAG: SGNH/GDSL hydrolase family protein [Woeseiaceae bacterium]|nr:SGNH/GDSL hydrolase family protein [Woeseiaceae bacterium]